MSFPAVDDTDIIRAIVGITRPSARRSDRRSLRSRPDAFEQMRYILHRIGIIAPDLYKRIELVLMDRLSSEDWSNLHAAMGGGVPPSRPLPRRSRSRVKEPPS